MKKLALALLLPVFFCGCFSMSYPDRPMSQKFHYKKIAILPFDIRTSVQHLPDGVTISMVENYEKKKARIMQRDLYRYILRELAKSSRKVKFQHVNDTNKRLKKKGITDEEVFSMSKKQLAKALKVDAVIYATVYQYKNKMKWHGDDFLRYTGGNNRVSTVLNVYEKRRGRIEWKYDSSQSGFPSDYAPDAIKGLLRKAARNFPM